VLCTAAAGRQTYFGRWHHFCVAAVQGGFDHYMQKEIHEQPEAILQTMRGRVAVERNEEVNRRQLQVSFPAGSSLPAHHR
jgi:glucosamine 6-phosphate synthetase-like amidotransferase/phosphosugar isomerase protein